MNRAQWGIPLVVRCGEGVSINGGVEGWAMTAPPPIRRVALLLLTCELVVSGINLSPNVGINVLYSGRVRS
jgi:hypothetical protein